ncbi:hypothetical protein GG681_06270 [Epibacterium sp. SM1969]|uniref:Uncharacterized protein n=1 Tax=Tritonibacter aquimaris TaxID=2663379 RepID=A0A844AKJ6_9RHOB|nr:hypothetical protein [Tritonibacter aquimaris]MQY42240.1 hypothetical protein [Tritonibacter aquimaris]
MILSEVLSSVVFVGHSLFGHDNPQMLDQLLDQGTPARVEAQIINGAPLQYHWQHAAEAEGINARKRLIDGVGAVIVTEAIPLANHLKWSNTATAVTQFYELARNANPDVDFYLQETWHSLNSGTGVAIDFDDGMSIPWRTRLKQDKASWQSIVDTVNAQTGGTVKLLEAGQALARLDDAIQAGTVPGLSKIQDVFADDIHPNSIGFYYLSLFQYAVLTGESPQGLPHQLKSQWGAAFDAPSPELAQRLQEIAEGAAQSDSETAALPADPAPLPIEPIVVRLNQKDTAFSTRDADLSQPMAMNLAPVADWSPQAPFLDHFKTARSWIGHLPGQWGGATEADLRAAGYLDENGWPTAIPTELSSIGTVLLADLPPEARSLAGRYRLTFDGDGIIEVSGRVENVRYDEGEVWFDFTPGPGIVDIRIQRNDRQNTGNYIRNIQIVKQEHLEAHAAGKMFNPRWLDLLEGFKALRFMDWMETNDSKQIGWEDRPLATDYTWARKGVPAEVMLRLANELGTAPWFTLPHQADDSYLRNFARLTHQQLDADLQLYVEFSNEVWNWQFEQAHWAEAQAQARWGKENLWMQFYGGRAAEMAEIWTDVFAEAPEDRLTTVIATQTGWLGLEEQLLDAPLWTAEHSHGKPPAAHFDAYAITGYFGGVLGRQDYVDVVRAWIADSRAHAQERGLAKGLRGIALRDFIAQHQFDIATAQANIELRDGLISGLEADTLADFSNRILPYHAKVAEKHGLDLIMYEGGSHVVGVGPYVDDEELTAFFTHFNYTAEMGELYRQLLKDWHAAGGVLFGAYADVSAPGKWGSWGSLRTLTDKNPRWDALEAAK